jgi:uncharacterized protein GlcG (DUF336 family)
MKIVFGAALAFALLGASVAQAQAPQTDQGMPGGQGGPGGQGQGGPRRPDVVAPSIPIDVAVAAAKAAQAACAGFKFGVAVLDQSGLPKLYYNLDGASGDHAARAAGKASAALLINAPSEGLKDRAAADPAIAAKVQAAKDKGTPMMTMAGGLPIVVNGQALGAIGVSGAEPGGHDPECVAAAMKTIQDRLGK